MAALTAASVQRESIGSLTLHTITFTAVTGDDTYASGLGTNVVGYIAQSNLAGGSTLVTGCNVLNTSGTFKFQVCVAATAVTLYILSKS